MLHWAEARETPNSCRDSQVKDDTNMKLEAIKSEQAMALVRYDTLSNQ
jgi:hypothetical protein